jgi:8-oxo-dGTP diphosphatase
MLICVVLAGGRGTRLIPLTDTTPKPLLKVGDLTLLEWNMKGVASFVDKFIIVISYLGQNIIDHIGDSYLGKPVEYVWQDNPKGGTLDAFRTAIFENPKQKNVDSTNSYLVIHADDIHGDITWQNMRSKIQSDPEKAYLSAKVLTDPKMASSFGMFQVKPKVNEMELVKLQQNIENENKQIIVDCLIVNEKGQILVQKRSAERKLFPNCWDLPGGHVDAGDTILGTLKKEVKEETNLEVASVVELLAKIDWNFQNEAKVILQFVVKVGDLASLKLEEGKATEFRWVGLNDDLEYLKENKTGDFYVFDTVSKALQKIQNTETADNSLAQFREFEFVQIVEKPDYYVSDFANIAISYFPSKVLKFIPEKLENNGKESYITDLFNEYSQNFPIEVVPTNGLWLPVTSINDLEKAREILA